MSASLLQNDKECYVTGSTVNLHKHHIYAGIGRRSNSEKWGCWVWLRGDWHNMANYGVHFNPTLDKELKAKCQVAFELKYGHDKFMSVFGKNYLEGNNEQNCFDR